MADDSVVGRGDLGDWSRDEVREYEAALDVYTGLIAWCGDEIEAELKRPDGDPTVVAELRSRVIEYQRARRTLNPADRAEVARVRRELGGLLKTESTLRDARGVDG